MNGKPEECCEEVRREHLVRIYHYLDGEVTQTEITEIETHLRHCSACGFEYEVESMLKELVRRCCLGDAPAPEGLRERIRSRILVSVEDPQGSPRR
ncbi:mycothiol system anti-sigma-R factor [Sediminivirga luteola]|jgi:mycothiol system anti-sigma-R factor|uniref:Putative zinc-finger domain-containing protein n=1 Tax=Sediminivirga luteola TaxID=1774748 RepID=A0A8J2XJP5_9MICO|nr:mycothiol system anti-sigma-R factor [Sediminivirga luteola]MCI2265656.1 mycothiol system anti-sigma-R factor [Sediminivirga luteola]GGA07614.1 hypothetical protein GCM10011333_07940 [Sediminivirga luteola]